MKVKWPRYRPGVAQRVGRGIALLFHDRGTRRGWVVSSTPRPHFTHGKDLVPVLQEAGWAPGPVWTGGKSRPHRDSIPDRPARSQSLYQTFYIPVCFCNTICPMLCDLEASVCSDSCVVAFSFRIPSQILKLSCEKDMFIWLNLCQTRNLWLYLYRARSKITQLLTPTHTQL